MKRRGRGIRLFAFNVVILVGTLAALETALRVAGWHPPGHFTNLRYDNDPLTGPSLLASQEGFFQTPCSRIQRIRVNRFGMRDRERSQTPNGARVALIGDSFTEGLHVADEDTVSRRLEALLGGEAEVLNFGVSSTGTAVQLMNYRARVRAFRSDVVLLMFYVGNDIADNLQALKRRMDPGMASISPYLVLDSGGNLAENPQPGQRRRTSPLVALASSSAIGQWVSRAYQVIRVYLAFESEAAAPDRASEEALLDEAWRVTEQVIERFFEEVRADGSRFALVIVPSDNTDANRRAVERLTAIADREPFPLLDLGAHFRRSTNPEGPDPFVCDGHWNANGHAAAAEALLKFLNGRQWITTAQ